jgi:eukaryotic-like serine/threonine-protein kinase
MLEEIGNSGQRARTLFIWRFGSAVLNEVLQELYVREAKMRVTPEALLVLRCLLRAAGRPVRKAELLQAVWGDRSPASIPNGVISRCVRELRRALTQENRDYLVTIRRGQGWQVDFNQGTGVHHEQTTAPAPSTPDLRRGLPAPGRSGHILERRLGESQGVQTWEASGGADVPPRIFKIATNDLGRALMKEALQRQLHLQDALGEPAGMTRVYSWSLLTAPSFVECGHAGQNLARWLAGKEPAMMPLLARVRLHFDITQTVAAAHDVGVLHRDLRAENIWISRQEQRLRAEVDFCCPWPADANRGARDTGENGPSLRAPELRDGRPASQKSEVYSLGMLLYQLASGKPDRTLEPGWSRAFDSDLGLVIVAATEPDPAYRTASAVELLQQLRALYPSQARATAA